MGLIRRQMIYANPATFANLLTAQAGLTVSGGQLSFTSGVALGNPIWQAQPGGAGLLTYMTRHPDTDHYGIWVTDNSTFWYKAIGWNNNGVAEFQQGLTATTVHATGDAELDGDLNHDGSNVGFYGTAPAAKQEATGSRGANAALASLLTALATIGLITDSSS